MTALLQLVGIKETDERVLALYRTWILLAEDGQPGPLAWRSRPEHLDGDGGRVGPDIDPKDLFQGSAAAQKQPAAGPSPNHDLHGWRSSPKQVPRSSARNPGGHDELRAVGGAWRPRLGAGLVVDGGTVDD